MSGRTKKSLINISAGIFYQIVSVLSSFICRTAMVRFLGLSVISLHGLYWQIVSMLSLAELGIGSAVVYHLYKPLAENNIEQIKRLMGLYRKCYQIIAAVCFLCGCIVTCFVPVFVNGLNYSNTYLRLVFFLYVVQMTVSYLFIADTALLQADQKRHKTICLQTIYQILITFIALLILYLWKSFVLYLLATIVSTLVMNFSCSRQARRVYPYLKETYVPLSREEAKPVFLNVRDIFAKKVAGYVTNSTDNICISVLTGTIQVGYYSNYAMLFSAVRMLEQQIANGFSASMGELAAKESSFHIDQTLRKMTVCFQLFGMVMSAGLMACSSTFIKLWIGKQYLLPSSVIFICCVNIYLTIVKDPLWQSMDACGMFAYDRNLAVISTIINLAVSIILGMQYGMIGIFLGTAVSTIFEIVLKASGLYGKKLRLSTIRYQTLWEKMAVSEAAVLLLSCKISTICIPSLYLEFFLQGCCAVVTAVSAWILTFPQESRELYDRISDYLKNRILPKTS